MWHSGQGTLIYDPKRPGLKQRTENWCIVSVDRELTRYFRWWVDKMLLNPLAFDGKGLCQPSWDAHISVIRGEKYRPEFKHLWKKYHNEKIDFLYSVNVRKSGDTTKGDRPDNYWFIEVDCPRLTEIRKEAGLPHDWRYFHITIGRTW